MYCSHTLFNLDSVYYSFHDVLFQAIFLSLSVQSQLCRLEKQGFQSLLL